MEVVRIKKEGYPFRETFDKFYARRVVASSLYRLLKLPASFGGDAAALKATCEQVRALCASQYISCFYRVACTVRSCVRYSIVLCVFYGVTSTVRACAHGGCVRV
jgi:hypothetical protein